jgi:hypothetical protein
MLNFPSNALARSLEDFLLKVRQSPGQAMRMPIQLRHGGGLGGGVHSIQVLATWAREESSERDLRLPEAFAAQENTRDRFASTLPGMAALYFSKNVTCDGSQFGRYKALEAVAPRITAMQNGQFRETLRGQAVALCCFIGARNEFLKPLYAAAQPGGVRELSEFRVLLPRMLEQLGLKSGALNDSHHAYLSTLIHQLFLNADEHGSFDPTGERYDLGVRGVALRLVSIPSLQKITEEAGEDTVFKTYLLKQVYKGEKKPPSLSEVEEQVLGSPMRMLEVSVFDTGPGLALRWLSDQSGKSVYADMSIDEEFEAVQTCFQKHATSTSHEFKGQGLSMALKSLKALGAFMTLRTGRLSLYQDFSRGDTDKFSPKNRFPKTSRLADIAGTSYSISFRVG